MWEALRDGMTAVIDLLYNLTTVIGLPSYALAIILLTVIIKVVLYPLTKKQMRSMVMMQKLAPEIEKIQKKYKNKDPQKMQQKIMELYKEHDVNPMSGCLPILIQLPILIALYRALLHYEFINPAHAHFIWIETLKHPDPFYILPVLAALTTFMQSKLVSNTSSQLNPSAAQTQKIMMYLMPLMIGWIATTLPAGLSLYWVVYNIVSAAQQYYINRQILATDKGVAEN